MSYPYQVVGDAAMTVGHAPTTVSSLENDLKQVAGSLEGVARLEAVHAKLQEMQSSGQISSGFVTGTYTGLEARIVVGNENITLEL